jgi:hypothetical protein
MSATVVGTTQALVTPLLPTRPYSQGKRCAPMLPVSVRTTSRRVGALPMCGLPMSETIDATAAGRRLRRARSGIDWWSIGSAVAIAACVIAALATSAHAARDPSAMDFRGLWRAARTILAGHNPYPAPDVRRLFSMRNPYVLPPLTALMLTPLAHLPFTAALAIWNAICAIAFGVALRLCGVRDWRVYVVACGSLPFVASLALGQPEGLFALALAGVWRYRDSWPSAVLVGILIAAKWFAWPLVLWFVLRRSYRLAGIAVATAAGLLVATWGVIGFDGLTEYPTLFIANTHATFRNDSISSLVFALGGSRTLGTALSVIAVLPIVAAIAWRSPADPLAGFTAAIYGGIMLSPLVWAHYLALLLVPLAIRHPRLDPLWLPVVLFWLSPSDPPASNAQMLLVIIVATVVALACRGQPVRPIPRHARVPRLVAFGRRSQSERAGRRAQMVASDPEVGAELTGAPGCG